MGKPVEQHRRGDTGQRPMVDSHAAAATRHGSESHSCGVDGAQRIQDGPSPHRDLQDTSTFLAAHAMLTT